MTADPRTRRRAVEVGTFVREAGALRGYGMSARDVGDVREIDNHVGGNPSRDGIWLKYRADK